MMKTGMVFVCLSLMPGATAEARDSKPADVAIYLSGHHTVPYPVLQRAKITVTWMDARIGVRLVWHFGVPDTSAAFAGPLVIPVRFVGGKPPAGVVRDALAYARPFGDGSVSTTS